MDGQLRKLLIFFLFVLCKKHVQTPCLMRKSKIPKLGPSVEVRAYYSTPLYVRYKLDVHGER